MRSTLNPYLSFRDNAREAMEAKNCSAKCVYMYSLLAGSSLFLSITARKDLFREFLIPSWFYQPLVSFSTLQIISPFRNDRKRLVVGRLFLTLYWLHTSE